MRRQSEQQEPVLRDRGPLPDEIRGRGRSSRNCSHLVQEHRARVGVSFPLELRPGTGICEDPAARLCKCHRRPCIADLADGVQSRIDIRHRVLHFNWRSSCSHSSHFAAALIYHTFSRSSLEPIAS